MRQRKNFTNQSYLEKGFSILEVLVSVAIFSFVLLAIISFLFSINTANSKSKADRETEENSRRIMDEIIYEVRGAKSVYGPTTASSQLSLETDNYLSVGETTAFIDFFVCGSDFCLKKESQNPSVLNSDSVEVGPVFFTQILSGAIPLIKIDLTVKHKNPDNNPINNSSVNLVSTVSLRNY
jgi:prepilin-type N-terminal cleavage/methylation domain-containing protein